MSRVIYGVTVGTTISPEKMREKMKDGIPPGGKAGQFLCKKSDKDYDVEWADFKIPEQYGLVTYDQDKTITIT